MSNWDNDLPAKDERLGESHGKPALFSYCSLAKCTEGGRIRVRGFVSNLTVKGKRGFVTLRSGLETVQCTYTKTCEEKGFLEPEVFASLSKTPLESFVEITGDVLATSFTIKNCTVQDREVAIAGILIISHAEDLPFSMKDISASEKEREDKSFALVSYNKCLDNRSLDLRAPHTQSIFRVVDNFMQNYRGILRKNGFLEIKTPKLIDAASEGGANCFQVDFFGRKAFLAQSPQLYKQMAVIGGMQRVYEIGHVYRAEESNINRYLSEFVGLDIEMEIETDHLEVIRLVYRVLTEMFDLLKVECAAELEVIRRFKHFEDIVYAKEPVIIKHRDCVDMLRVAGYSMGYDEDFNRECERAIAAIVKEKYHVDFFVVRDYPLGVRAFYTKRSDTDPLLSNSFDFILRGDEVLSGAQRTHNHRELVENVERLGINKESIRGYLDAFRYGAPLHGGVGIGLERLVKTYLGLSDIRYVNMFPRDPSRLYP